MQTSAIARNVLLAAAVINCGWLTFGETPAGPPEVATPPDDDSSGARRAELADPEDAVAPGQGDGQSAPVPEMVLPEETGTEDTMPVHVMESGTESDLAVEQIDRDREFYRLKHLLTDNSFAQTQQEVISPFLPDVPRVASPLEEVSAFGLPLTAWNSKLHFLPHLSVSGVYDDNIFLTPNHKTADYITAISPGVALTLGDDSSPLMLSADYTPSFLFFADNPSQDTVDQTASLNARYAFTKLTLGLHLSAESATGGSTDVGDLVRRNVGYAGLSANYVLDEKFSFDMAVDGSIVDYNNLLGSTERRVQGWLNYQATGKINVGFGTTVGLLDVKGGPSQVYQEVLGRVSYDATAKLVLSANGGLDIREVDGTTSPNPVFGIGAVYSPFASTTITADLYERIYGSAVLLDQNYTATGVTVSLRQQLRPSLAGSLTTGYMLSNYYAVAQTVPATRVDNFYFVRVGPEWQITRWCNALLFYEYSEDDSSGYGARSFTRDRVGIQATISF